MRLTRDQFFTLLGLVREEITVKPYKRHFNYATCRARRVTENAFGILCHIFRIFVTPINLKPETVDLVIFVSCCLHNWIRDGFIARNPKGLVTHPQHELPTQNMIPLAYVGGYAKAEGLK
ncbi:hypothetical protein J6590_015712 [Homalodisca vitripennis]|nr:hypothetical protein J6590_015712 [Homalodisca vitripennis]